VSAPKYQEFQATKIPVETLATGRTVRVISGQTDKGTEGPVKNRHTNPLYLDGHLNQENTFQPDMLNTHGGFVYVIEGSVHIDEKSTGLSPRMLGVLSDGDRVRFHQRT
jgi:redox-sensitive bicupin YhaK (pirin superfamily)